MVSIINEKKKMSVLFGTPLNLVKDSKPLKSGLCVLNKLFSNLQLVIISLVHQTMHLMDFFFFQTNCSQKIKPGSLLQADS